MQASEMLTFASALGTKPPDRAILWSAMSEQRTSDNQIWVVW